MITSASDNRFYPEFCGSAADNETIFATFRQSPVYQAILEHFSYEAGLKYLHEIRSGNPAILKDLEVFRTNDCYGGAETAEYEGIGMISPSTLYYIRQLSYLDTYFGDLGGKHIVEVGCGYGGLAKLVMDKYDIASYTCFDLDQVMRLTAKYLGKFGDRYLNKVTFCHLDTYAGNRAFDLFISNCAFTECVPPIQEAYLDKVIRNCSSGFMTYNQRVESMHPVKLLSKLEKAGLRKMGSNQLVPAVPTVFIVAWNAVISLKPLPYRRRLVYKLSPFIYRYALKFVQLFKAK